MALPLIRDRWRPDMTEGEARALLEDCMRVLWYRDTKALNKITLAKVGVVGGSCRRDSHLPSLSPSHPPPHPPLSQITPAGSVISEPYALSTRWDFQAFVTPKANTDTGGSW